MFITLVRTDNSPAQLFIRCALGVVMFPHGAQKIFGWFGGTGFTPTLEWFSQMGLPALPVVVLMLIEFVGSVLLIAGLLTRLWAVGFAATITVSMFLNHAQHGFFMNWLGQQQGEGIEYHLLALGMISALLVRGGGLLSIDRALTPDSEVL